MFPKQHRELILPRTHSLKTRSHGICQIIGARRNSNHRLGTFCSPEHNQKIHLKNLTETLQLKGGESINDLQAVPRRNVDVFELSKINSNIETNSVCKCFYISQRFKQVTFLSIKVSFCFVIIRKVLYLLTLMEVSSIVFLFPAICFPDKKYTNTEAMQKHYEISLSPHL